ncbi:hypothetical protein D3C86_1785820 [compost metagenome]
MEDPATAVNSRSGLVRRVRSTVGLTTSVTKERKSSPSPLESKWASGHGLCSLRRCSPPLSIPTTIMGGSSPAAVSRSSEAPMRQAPMKARWCSKRFCPSHMYMTG